MVTEGVRLGFSSKCRQSLLQYSNLERFPSLSRSRVCVVFVAVWLLAVWVDGCSYFDQLSRALHTDVLFPQRGPPMPPSKDAEHEHLRELGRTIS